MSCAASILLFVAIVAGGSVYQYGVQRLNAVIYYPDGRIELVRVVNHTGNYCPVECAVHHRHRVHDVRCECMDGEDCKHFTVLHVICRADEDHHSALEREIRNAKPELTVLAVH